MCRSRCRPGGDRRSDEYAACGDNELGSNGNSDAEVGAGGVLNVEGTARRQLSWRQISQIAPLSRQRHQCDQGRVAGERGIAAPNCNLWKEGQVAKPSLDKLKKDKCTKENKKSNQQQGWIT